MRIKDINKTYLIISLIVLIVGSLYGVDKWVDNKIAKHENVITHRNYIDDNEEEILEVKDFMLRLEEKIDKLNDKIDLLLMQEYP